MKSLYKSTIIIWTEFDPNCFDQNDLLFKFYPKYLTVSSNYIFETMGNKCYCFSMTSEKIDDPEKDPDWNNEEYLKQ